MRKDNNDLNEGMLHRWLAEAGQKFNDFMWKAVQEVFQLKEAARIFTDLVKGEVVSEDEIDYLEEQLIDVFKGMGLSVVFLAPGGAFLVTALVKFARKHNINALPSVFNEIEEDDIEENRKDDRK